MNVDSPSIYEDFELQIKYNNPPTLETYPTLNEMFAGHAQSFSVKGTDIESDSISGTIVLLDADKNVVDPIPTWFSTNYGSLPTLTAIITKHP